MRARGQALWLLAAGSVLAASGCGKTANCRPGTLFLDVQLGAHAANDQLEVDVAVSGEAPRTTTLTLPAGAASGGVEVQFPNGYPAGKPVQMDVKLTSAAGVVVREGMQSLTPSGSCEVLAFDLRAGDAGSQDATADSMGGGAGAGGAGGSGGAGGAGGAAGAGGCVPRGAEDCFNGVDDDCNGMIDCADPACGAAIATCVALDPTNAPIGILEGGAGPCPGDYANATTIMAGLNPGSCTGCTCGAGPVTCSSSINDFGGLSLCSLGGAGSFVQTLSSTAAGCSVPAWHLDGSGNIGGIKAGAFAMTPSNCPAMGAWTLSPPTWTARGEFCATAKAGGGCGAGKVCIPALPDAASACQLLDGARACPAGATGSSWYTGFSSTLDCGACTCGSPSGGSCASAQITVGASGTCGTTAIPAGGAAVCMTISAPGIEITGATTGTCQPQTALTGSVAATGAKTLCCL